MVDPLLTRRWLEDRPILQGKKIDLDALANFLTRVRGIRLLVRIGDSIVGEDKFKGELHIDFGEPIAGFAAILQPLLMELLDDMGAVVDDFKTWKPRFDNRTIILQGTLKGPGIRQILSIVQPPSVTPAEEEEPTIVGQKPGVKPLPSGEAQKAAASQRYFKAVTTMLNDLREKARTQNEKQSAYWHTTFAQQIDSLPMLNVDDELLAYSADVATKLRAIATSLSGVSIDTELLQRQKASAVYSDPGSYSRGGGYGWGGGGWGASYEPRTTLYMNNFQQVKAAQSVRIRQGAGTRLQVWEQIDNDTSNIRRRMVNKYNAEF
jgi:hypothetical protein